MNNFFSLNNKKLKTLVQQYIIINNVASDSDISIDNIILEHFYDYCYVFTKFKKLYLINKSNKKTIEIYQRLNSLFRKEKINKLINKSNH